MTKSNTPQTINRKKIVTGLARIRQGWEDALEGDWDARHDIPLLLRDISDVIGLTADEQVAALGPGVLNLE